jgi:hypothetical protein
MHDGEVLTIFWARRFNLCHVYFDGYEAGGFVSVDGLSWHVGWRWRGIEVEVVEICVV